MYRGHESFSTAAAHWSTKTDPGKKYGEWRGKGGRESINRRFPIQKMSKGGGAFGMPNEHRAEMLFSGAPF